MTRGSWLVLGCMGVLGTAGGAFANNALRPTASEVERYCDIAQQGAHKLSEDLRHREREVQARESALLAAESELALSQSRLDERLAALDKTRDEIRALLGQADGEREERLLGLVKMVESSRANQVAPMFEKLEPALAVDVLDRMNRTKAGRLLVALPSAHAADLARRMTDPIVLPVSP